MRTDIHNKELTRRDLSELEKGLIETPPPNFKKSGGDAESGHWHLLEKHLKVRNDDKTNFLQELIHY